MAKVLVYICIGILAMLVTLKKEGRAPGQHSFGLLPVCGLTVHLPPRTLVRRSGLPRFLAGVRLLGIQWDPCALIAPANGKRMASILSDTRLC